MKEMQLSRIIDMEDPQSVFDEVRTIVFMMFPEFDFDTVDHVFKDDPITGHTLVAYPLTFMAS